MCCQKSISKNGLLFLLTVICLNGAAGATLRSSERRDEENPTKTQTVSMAELRELANTVRKTDTTSLIPFAQLPNPGVNIPSDLLNNSGGGGNNGNTYEDRIVGGQDASAPYEYFTMLLDQTDDGIFWAGCGATLIASDILLTAGHCVYGREDKINIAYISAFAPWFGNLGHNKAVKTITEHIIHPGYKNQQKPTHDMAILKLSDPVTDLLRPIKLPETDSDQYASNGPLTIVGFGHTSYPLDSSTPQILQEGLVQYESDCSNVAIDDTMLCAQGNSFQTDACQGDSGGPIIQRIQGQEDVLVGVTSWGVGCALPGYPGVYSSTAKARSWLLSTVCAKTGDASWDDLCASIQSGAPSKAPSKASSNKPSNQPSKAPSKMPSPSPVSSPNTPTHSTPQVPSPNIPTQYTSDEDEGLSNKPSNQPSKAPSSNEASNEPSKSPTECLDISTRFHFNVNMRLKHKRCNWSQIKDYCNIRAMSSDGIYQIRELCPNRCNAC